MTGLTTEPQALAPTDLLATGTGDRTAPHAAAPAPSPRLALIEVLDRDGRVRTTYPVHHWPVRIGRSMDCEVLLDDPQVAALHATLAGGPDIPTELQVGDTRNGVRVLAEQAFAARATVARRKRASAKSTLAAGQVWAVPPAGAQLQVGEVLLRVRLPGEALPAEVVPAPHKRLWLTVLCALLVWASALIEQALGRDPGASWNEWLMPVLSPPLAVGAWCLVWSLASKLFQHRFDFLSHLALVVRVLALALVVDWLLPPLAFAGSWTWLVKLEPDLLICGAALLLWVHAVLVLPQRRWGLSVFAVAAVVAASGYAGAQSLQRQDRWFRPLRLSWIGPPALRLAPTVPVASFIASSNALRQTLEQRVAKDAREQQNNGGDAAEDDGE